MEPNTAAPLQRRRRLHTMNAINLGTPITGTITIGTNGSLSASPAEQGWQVDGKVITIDSRSDTDYYSLTLEPPSGWSWNPSSSLQFFQDNANGNVCGFYSRHDKIEAFNSNNQTAQILAVILNLVNESGHHSPFTVFLVFGAASPSPTPSGDTFSPQHLTPVEGDVLGTVHTVQNNPDQIDHVHWHSFSLACSTINSMEEEPQIKLKPISGLGLEVKSWDLSLTASGEGWEVSSSSPAFQICFFSNLACGLVFSGPAIRAYNHLQHEDSAQIFNLALKMTNGATTQWIDDPAVVFDPPDPPTITLQS